MCVCVCVGGGVYLPIFEVGGYHDPQIFEVGMACIIIPHISSLHVLLYRQNILSTNKNNERNSRFGIYNILYSILYRPIDYLAVGVCRFVQFIVPCRA